MSEAADDYELHPVGHVGGVVADALEVAADQGRLHPPLDRPRRWPVTTAGGR